MTQLASLRAPDGGDSQLPIGCVRNVPCTAHASHRRRAALPIAEWNGLLCEPEMESSVLFPSLSQVAWLALVLAGVLAAVAIYRRGRPSLDAEPVAAPAKIVYHDAPTVRVSGPQRFDRLRRVVRLAPGEHADLMQPHPVVGPRFRLTLNAIGSHDGADAAHLSVVYADNHVSCGPLAKEMGFNEFLLPRAARDLARSAVFHYQELGDVLDFMRISVRDIDTAEQRVEFEIMHTRGQWPGSTGEH